MLVEGPELAAVRMDDPAAVFAAEEEAVPLPAVAVAVAGALLRCDLVDEALALQPLQLAVDGGKAHRGALVPQLLRQSGGAEYRPAPAGKAVQNGLLLLGVVWHGILPPPRRADPKIRIIFKL